MCAFSTLILLVGYCGLKKTVARITYTVLVETLNPAQSINLFTGHMAYKAQVGFSYVCSGFLHMLIIIHVITVSNEVRSAVVNKPLWCGI